MFPIILMYISSRRYFLAFSNFVQNSTSLVKTSHSKSNFIIGKV